MSLNSIAGYQFLAIDGLPQGLREQVELVERQGLDGTAIWRTGRRGTRFTLTSKVDQPSLPAAFAAYNGYASLVAAGAVPLVWSGVSLGLFDVLDVRLQDARAIRSATGGINPPSLAWLSCEWDLIAV